MAKSEIYLEDNTIKVINNVENAIEAALLECAAELVSETVENTRAKSGQLKNSWSASVDKTKDGYEAIVGSPLENAIWEEFGTGEHAIKADGSKGNGRKGYWVYVDDGDNPAASSMTSKSYTLKEAKKVVAIMREKGLNAYYTNGKKPSRAFYRAIVKTKPKIVKRLQKALKESNK
jgi:hypothetical protein